MPNKQRGSRLASQIERQWALLRCLPEGRNPVTTEALWLSVFQKMPGVTKRTIERDLLHLEVLFPIAKAVDGRTNRWSWERGARPWMGAMGADEAFAYFIAERVLSATLPASVLNPLQPHFELARRKLAGGDRSTKTFRQKFFLANMNSFVSSRDVNAQVAHSVSVALLENRPLKVRLRDATNAAAFDKGIYPRALVLSEHGLQLVATTLSNGDPVTLPLDSIWHATLSEQSFRRAPFKPELFLGAQVRAKEGRTYSKRAAKQALDAIISTDLARRLRALPIAADQIIERISSKKCRLRASVALDQRMVDWVVTQGSRIEVRSPHQLREKVRRLHMEGLSQYKEASLA